MNEEQWRNEYASLDSPQSETPVSSVPVAAVKPKRGMMFVWAWAAIALLVASSSVLVLLWLHQKVSKNNSNSQGTAIKVQDVDTTSLGKAADQLDINSANKVVVNGQLRSTQGVVISPTAQPNNALAGQLYVDQDTKEIRFYNGQNFVSLANQNDVSNLSASLANLTAQLGGANANLSNLSSSLSTATVTSLQNQSGALTLLGTGGLSVSAASSNITLALPQNLTTTGNPSFSSVTLSSPLAVASGGTGASSFNANEVLIGNGSGAIQSVTPSGAGLCLVSTAGAPMFTSCSGGGAAVASVNNQTGAISIANATGAGGVNGTITIDNASTSGKGIAQFNSTNFTASSGVVNTIQNIASSASPTFVAVLTNAITPSSSLTLGSVGQSFTLQGSNASVITAGNGSFTSSVGFASPTANRNITFGDESGTVCTTAGSAACTSVYAPVSGSSAYIQFAPTSAQVDHTCDGNPSCTGSTIYVSKTSTYGDILRLQGTGDSGTTDAFRLQANGDMYFQSLTQSTTAFRILDSLANPVLTINTKPSTPSCTVDFDGESGNACAGTPFANNISAFTAYDEGTISSPTSTSLYTYSSDPSYNHTNSGSTTGQSLKITNGVHTIGSKSGVYAPYSFVAGQPYYISVWAERDFTSGNVNNPFFNVGYYYGSSPASGTTITPSGCSSSNNLSKPTLKSGIYTSRWHEFTCGFYVQAGGGNPTGIFIRSTSNGTPGGGGSMDNKIWYVDDIVVKQGQSNSDYQNFVSLTAPIEVSPPQPFDHALNVKNADGDMFTVDTTNRQVNITVTRPSDQFSTSTLPALYVTNDNGPAALFASTDSANNSPTVVIQQSGSAQDKNLLSLQNSSGAELAAFDQNGQLLLYKAAGSNKGTIKVSSGLTSSQTYTFPNASGEVCLSSGNCVGSGSSSTLQAAYDAGNSITTNDASNIAFNLADTSTDAKFTVDLQGTGSAIQFSDTGTVFANFNKSGQVTFQNTVDGTGFAVKDSLGNGVLAVDTSNELVSLGSSAASGKLQFKNSSNSNTVTLQSGTTGSNLTFTLPTADGSANQCLQTNGSGVLSFATCTATGGVSSPGGTTGAIAKFTGSNTIGDSLLSEFGTTITNSGSLVVQGSNGVIIGNAVGMDGKLSFQNATNSNTLTLQTGATSSNLTFTLPTSDGSSNQCLQTNGSGVLSFANCVGGSGGASGVVSVQGASGGGALTGALTLNNASGSGTTLTIDNASASAKGIAKFSSSNFSVTSGDVNLSSAVSLTGTLGVAGNTTVGTIGTATGQLYVSGQLPSSNLGSVGTGTAPRGVAVQGNYAYVTNSTSGNMQIIDVSNPASPTVIGQVNTGTSPRSVVVQGRYAYVANNGSNTVTVYDVSNPVSPTQVRSVATGSGTQPVGLYVKGRYLFVTYSNTAGLQAIDISNPSSPTLVGSPVSTGSNPVWVTVQGRYAYVANSTGNSFQIFDVNNPAATIPAALSTVTTGTSPVSISVVGRYAYVINSTGSSFQIFDISNPSSVPAALSVTNTALSGPRSLFVQGRYVYIANLTNSTMLMYDVSNPASPTSLGTVSTGSSSSPIALVVQGRYAYVANNGNSTLVTFDLGGEYAQQFEAGGVQTTTLQVTNNFNVYNDGNIQGGLNVSGSLEVGNSAGFYNGASFNTGSNTIGVSIGSASTAALVVGSDVDSTTIAGGIAFGTSRDTTLYRSAAGTLKTDGILNVGGLSITNAVISAPGSLSIASSASQPLTIDSDGGSIVIGNVNINAKNVTIGNTTTTSTVSIQGGSTGSVTLTGGAAATTYTIGRTDSTGVSSIILGQSTQTNTIQIGNANIATGKIQTINIGAGNAGGTGKVVVKIGNTNDASSLQLDAGTGNIDIGTGNQARIVHIATGGATQTVQIGSQSGSSSVQIQGGANGAISIANDSTQTIILGALNVSSLAQNIVIGNNSLPGANTQIILGSLIDSSSTLIQGGTGSSGIQLKVGSGGTLSVGDGGVASTIQIGNTTGAVSQTIRIGNNATGGSTTTTTIGSTTSGSNLTLQSGSGSIDIQSTTGAISIGTASNDRTVAIATGAANQTLILGSLSGTSSLSLEAGTGNISIGASNSARTVQIATGAAAQTVTLGSASGASSLTLLSGSGVLSVQSVTGEIRVGTTNAVNVKIGVITGGGTLTISGVTTFNGHLISGNETGSTTAASNANCGTGCTVAVAGNDTAGIITINSGTGAAAGTQVTITFANAYGSAPVVVITPETVPASSNFPQYYYGSSTTTFDLKTYNALTDSKTYKFSYHIMQ